MATLAKIQHIPNYVGQLRQNIGYYLPWVPNRYADQVSADDFYETIRRDVEISRAMNLLSLMAAGQRVEVAAKDKRIEEILSFALSQIGDFLHARKSLVEKAVLFGLGIQRKYYKKVEKFGLTWDVCHRLQEVDRRRMRLERDPDDKTKLFWTMWSLKIDQYIVLEDLAENPMAGEGCAVQDYIWYVNQYEELSPYHEGIADTLYTLAYIKSKAIQYWADLAESWAKPFLVAAIDTAKAAVDAALGSGFKSMAARASEIIDTFERARARHIAVIDSSDKIEWHERGSTGSNIIRELIEYCDKKSVLLILGSELSTNAGDVGSYAQATVHDDKLNVIVEYQNSRAAETLREDLAQDFLYRNQENLYRLGIPTPIRGEYEIRLLRKKTDPQGDPYGDRSLAHRRQA